MSAGGFKRAKLTKKKAAKPRVKMGLKQWFYRFTGEELRHREIK